MGKTYEMMARPIPQDQKGGYEITQFDRPASMELKLWQGTRVTTYRLDVVDGGTRLVYETNVELSGIAKPFEPVVGWLTTRSRGPRMLANLKSLLESDLADQAETSANPHIAALMCSCSRRHEPYIMPVMGVGFGRRRPPTVVEGLQLLGQVTPDDV